MNKKSGFTLIEVILVLVLVVIVIGGALSIFAPGFSLFNKSKEINKAKDLANQVMLVVEDYVHDAKTFVGNDAATCGSYSTQEYIINKIEEVNGKLHINGQIADKLPEPIYEDMKIDVIFYDGTNKLATEVKIYDSMGKEVYKINTKISSQSKDTVYEVNGYQKRLCLAFKK